MNVLFAWRRTPPPLLIGGAEVTQQLMAEEFAAAQDAVTYLGSYETPWDGTSQLAELQAVLQASDVPYEWTEGILRYEWHGVPCIAAPQQAIPDLLDELLDHQRPDLLFTSQEGAADLAARARKRTYVVGILHSVSKTGLGVLDGRPQHALAVSEFVRRRAAYRAGTVVDVLHPPFVQPEPVACPAAPRSADVLMVNPVPAKGAALLQELIRLMPDQHFTLVEGWWNTEAEFAAYPNVTYQRRTYDMTPLYRRHRLLLVPSVVDDAFPRVIVEAGLHGTPSVGIDRGGIPEAIGSAGLVLPGCAGAEEWVRAVRTVDHLALGEKARQQAAAFARPRLPLLRELGIYPPVNAAST